MFEQKIEIATNDYCIDKLMGRISTKMGSSNAQKLKSDAIEIVENCVDVYSKEFGTGDIGLTGSGLVTIPYRSSSIPDKTTGLIYGKVQSGKTITTISALAMLSANKFKCFIILTSDNTWLGKQTAGRFRTELDGGPVVYDWEQWRRDPKSFGKNLKDYVDDTGVVLVSTKNVRNLESLLEVLKTAGVKNVPSIIFDDEADNASLNTSEAKQAKKGKKYTPDSTIFDLIGKVRQYMPNHIYLQITATPQSLLLQNLNHPCKPSFCKILKPGDGYMGGNMFFGDNSLYHCDFDVKELEVLKGGSINPGNSWSIPKGLRDALCCFFLASMYKMSSSNNLDEIYSCLIHICYKRISHANIENVIRDFIVELDKALRDKLTPDKKKDAIRYLEHAHVELKKTAFDMPELNILIDELKHKLRNAIPQVINADNPDKEPNYTPGMNILIGGNRLGRGVTIDGLLITYYGRDAKQKTMDTVHQHARMFGYRAKLKDVTRLFVPSHIFNDFCTIHESDEGMREVIGDNPRDLSIQPVWVGEALQPTRANVLNPSKISAFIPGRSTFPRDPMWKKHEVKSHTLALDELLAPYSEDTEYYEVEINLMIELLSHTPSRFVGGYPWEDNRIRQALLAMKKQGIKNGRLNVRRGKDRKGLERQRLESWGKNGFFTSSWTKKAKDDYPNVPTLVLGYEKGEKIKKWDDQPLYLPTLVFPKTKFVFMFNYDD